MTKAHFVILLILPLTNLSNATRGKRQDDCTTGKKGLSEFIFLYQANIIASNQTEAQWGCWSEWSSCSVSCGQPGTRSRNAECQPGVETNGTQNTECDGDGIESESCTEVVCPSDELSSAYWSEWTSWSACSVSCNGPGMRFRQRNCVPDESLDTHENIFCNGDSKEGEICGDFNCPQVKHCPLGFQYSFG